MTKAEERALEFYPMKDYNKEPNYIHSCDSKMLDKVYREVFVLGYESAEKDLALTWEDMKTIEQIIATSDWYDFELNGKLWSKEFYEEVLKRYLEAKK